MQGINGVSTHGVINLFVRTLLLLHRADPMKLKADKYLHLSKALLYLRSSHG